MPDLPTITVTTGQLAKLLEVFPGGAPEYQAWLSQTLIDEVIRRNVRAIDEQANTAKAAALAAIRAELPEQPAVPE